MSRAVPHTIPPLPTTIDAAWALVEQRAAAAVAARAEEIRATKRMPLTFTDVALADEWHNLVPDLSDDDASALLFARLAHEDGDQDAATALLARIPTTHTPPAWRAWATQEAVVPHLDGARAATLEAGVYLSWEAELVAAELWHQAAASDDPESSLALIHALGVRWQQVARDAHPGGTDWAHTAGWTAELLYGARECTVPTVEDNAAALVLWRAGCEIAPPTPVEGCRGAVLMFIRQHLNAAPDRPALVPHLPLAIADHLGPPALLFGAAGRTRLATYQLSRRADTEARRARAHWRLVWAGEDARREALPWENPLPSPERFLAFARELVEFPLTPDQALTDGRECVLPVTMQCFEELHARYASDSACEGLRLLSIPPRADELFPRFALALTLAHIDARGPRRVSALLWTDERGGSLCDGETTAGWAREQAERLGAPIAGMGVLPLDGDDEEIDQWFFEVSVPTVAARADVLAAPGCTHRQRTWHEIYPEGFAACTCEDCEAELLRGFAWQMPDMGAYTAPLPTEEYCVRIARAWAIITGEDPDAVPSTIAELRARDGVLHWRLQRTTLFAGRSLRDTLGGR